MPITVGPVKFTSKGQVEKDYQTPYGVDDSRPRPPPPGSNEQRRGRSTLGAGPEAITLPKFDGPPSTVAISLTGPAR